ncbi:capsid protein [White spot syndrome virus]|uniref:Wsv220 n=5 Tax=White spot syndrome virus TaxID=342409 RepID=Q8VAZ5_WSSVS
MAGNRTQFVSSLIAKCISDVEQGMECCGRQAQDALMTRLANLKLGDSLKETDVNLEYLRYASTPLLGELNYDKQQYAATVDINLMAHFSYAALGIESILNSIRRVVVANHQRRNNGKKPSEPISRPHPLGGVEPPLSSELANAIRDKFISMGALDRLNSAIVTAALGAIASERELFLRENAVNYMYDVEFAERDAATTDTGNVVYLSTKMDEDEDDIIKRSEILDKVSKRPAKEGIDWRPTPDNSFPYQLIWGDDSVDDTVLIDLITNAIVPNIFMAKFILFICNHLRAVIRSMREILYGNISSSSDNYFEDGRKWCFWLNLYNRLEWFMLVVRFVIFLHSKKESFSGADNVNVKRLLVVVVESFPPVLLDTEWVKTNITSWPVINNSNNNSTLPVTEDTLMRLAIRTSSGARHPIFDEINSLTTAVTNRITFQSAEFCTKILLGRALDEEEAGTKMLVKSVKETGEEKDKNNTFSSFGLLLKNTKNEELEINIGDNDDETTDVACWARTSSTSFIRNRTYAFKKIWGLEDASDVVELKRESDAITSFVTDKSSPLLFPYVSDWSCLLLHPCCKAPAIIKSVWLQILKDFSQENIKTINEKVQSLSSEICQKSNDRFKNKKIAAEHVRSVKKLLNTISNREQEAALSTEHCIWLTILWKQVVQNTLNLLENFPV